MDATNTTATFDPLTQNITFLLADGVTPYTFNMAMIDAYSREDFAMAINFGAQLGGCLLMLFCVLLLTRDGKRWGLLFNLNIACLFTGFLSRLFFALYYVSPYTRFFTYYSLDTPQVSSSAEAVSITSAILPIFLAIFINLSLFFQAHTVLRTVLDKRIRYAVTFISALVFLDAMGWRFAEAVLNVQAIVRGEVFYEYTWLINGALAAETIAIWYFTVVFTTKLVLNLKARRILKQPSWSKMEVITVMGFGTMIIPSIFAIVEWIRPTNFPQAGSLTTILVVLLLPLSSLWASVTPNSPTCSMRTPGSGSQTSVNGSRSFGDKFGSISTGISSKFGFMQRRKSSTAPLTTTGVSAGGMESARAVSPMKRDSTEVDLERMGVRVERSYSVHTARS